MSSTTIPDVKVALKAMVSGLTEVTTGNVEVSYAERAERRKDAIWFGESHISELEPASFRAGRSRRHESFVLDLYVEASALKPEAAETKAFALVRAIEQAIADDPKVDNTPNLSWAFVESIQSNTAENGDGAWCQIELSIRCRGSFV